ncbi:MAG: Omp28-related outer membrane protein [Chitinophagales bacterium]
MKHSMYNYHRSGGLSIVAALMFLCSCKEVIPDFPAPIVPQAGDTTYIESPVATAEAKNVVIEEFTGVNCVNCPQGAQNIRAIEDAHPGRIVAIGMHSRFLSEPFSFSTQDLRTAEAEQLSQLFVDPGFKPAATIDRFVYDGSNPSLQYDRLSWAGYVNQRLAIAAPANVAIRNSFNTGTRELTATIEVHFTQAITGKTRLTVVLTEDSINTAQLDAGNVIDTIYYHRHVQRQFLTPYDGLDLGTDAEPGRVYRRNFKVTIPVAPVTWEPEHLYVAAYVHRADGSREVLQGKISSIR